MIDLSVEDNYASILDADSKVFFFIESFDNRNFEIRAGSSAESKFICEVTAEDNAELNARVQRIINSHLTKSYNADGGQSAGY